MALSKFLLDILVCPEQKTSVSLIPQDAVAKVNALIREHKLKNRVGVVITEEIDGGLLREDKKILYPVRSEIPIMLIDEGIKVDEVSIFS